MVSTIYEQPVLDYYACVYTRTYAHMVSHAIRDGRY